MKSKTGRWHHNGSMLPLLWLAAAPGFHAGAAAVDVTPATLPVIVNCGFAERTSGEVTSRLYAKALVLSEGQTRVAIAIVDSCMMPRTLLDRAKAQASARTGIPVDRMLIAATHTHSAPSSHACLGSDEQPGYADFLAGKIADAITQASTKRQPAQLGSSVVDAKGYTHSRRFLYRVDRALTDPFGQQNVFANMHPGYQHLDAVGPSGPVDSALTVLSIQTRRGAPLAVLANFSMHYFGSQHLSADYAGVFATQLKQRLNAPGSFVPIFSQGTSGDLHWMDYSRPKVDRTIEEYTAGLVTHALTALGKIKYASRGVLAMSQTTLTAGWRRPDATRLKWARDQLSKMPDVKPRSQPDVYAREAVMLSEKPAAELILQALRIGDLAVTALPNEVFAITGLKLKARSPLPLTMNLELANGAEGYIPPPEQHALGGYTTWPARSAGLEPDTEPRVVAALLALLEQVTGVKRRSESVVPGASARAVAASKPDAYWPMENLDSPGRQGGEVRYEGKYALYLDGLDGRAAYLAKGRLLFPFQRPAGDYTLELWAWSAATKQWQHQAAVCQGGELIHYLDGQAEPQGDCRVGTELFPIAFEGKVDEVAFYRRALALEELERHRGAAR